MDAKKLHDEAIREGFSAGQALTPPAMDVQDTFTGQSWHVPDGPCGFAWVIVPGNSSFIRQLKKTNPPIASTNINDFGPSVEWKKSISQPGYMFWVSEFGQSYYKKKEMAKRMAEYLKDNGVKAHWGSRLD